MCAFYFSPSLWSLTQPPLAQNPGLQSYKYQIRRKKNSIRLNGLLIGGRGKKGGGGGFSIFAQLAAVIGKTVQLIDR